MAHEVQVFCELDQEPAAVRDELLASVAGAEPVVDRQRSGDNWVSCELTRPGSSGAVLLEVHVDDEAAKIAVEFAASLSGAPDLTAANGLLVITLTGGAVDVDLVSPLLRTARESWRGVVFDEASGFAADPA